MSGVLEPSEVHALLSAADPGDAEGVLTTGPMSTPPAEIIRNAVVDAADAFGLAMGTTLAGWTRWDVSITASAPRACSYDQYIRSVPIPCCCCTLHDTLAGRIGLEIGQPTAMALIARMLGGRYADAWAPSRPLTLIETHLIQRLATAAAGHLSTVWDLESPGFAVDSLETDPLRLRLAGEADRVVVVTLAIRFDGHAGKVTLCLPSAAVASLVKSRPGVSDDTRNKPTHPTNASDDRPIRADGATELRAILARTTITGRELRSMRCGDVITTDTPARSSVRLVDGRTDRFAGRAVRVGHRIVVQVTQTLTAHHPNPSAGSYAVDGVHGRDPSDGRVSTRSGSSVGARDAAIEPAPSSDASARSRNLPDGDRP